jgi:hypothetical protein
MAQVVFDYAAWAARYPEFSTTVTQQQATELFAEACLYLDNSDGSVVQDMAVRALLLNMIVAHIAKIAYGTNGQPASGLVGRIETATEGSVTVTARYPDSSGLAAWFNQTPYGAGYWAATARYRIFRYVPGCRPRLRT